MKYNHLTKFFIIIVLSIIPQTAVSAEVAIPFDIVGLTHADSIVCTKTGFGDTPEAYHPSPFELPYSITGRIPDWHRLWVNTATLSGAFIGTLLVLECLPEDATSWNRAELQDVPLFKRWHNHVIKKGPEWDHDKFYFNYILHPYAGSVYFMSARSCGFNFWQSLLYCSLVSNVGWEFGIEAFMERPSYQDMLITPLVGSAIGECSYRLKRRIVENDYKLAGSHFLGNLVVFVIDPVNEVIDLFRGSNTRVFFLRETNLLKLKLLSFQLPMTVPY